MSAAKKQQAEQIDIDGYRELIADAVGLEVGELTGVKRDDPKVAILRRIAAYVIAQQDGLPLGDVARILDDSESWVRSSIDDIQRRISKYGPLGLRIEQMAAGYALASVRAGKPASGATSTGVAIESYRQRIASAVGMTVAELVAFERDDDAEIVQRVATYLLLEKEELPASEVALVMGKDEQWVRSAREYVRRRLKRDSNLKNYVEKTTAGYSAAIGGSRFLATANR